MDRYIVKNPRPKKAKNAAEKKPNFKQTTIESLKGVVVIEEVLRLKAILKLKNQSNENLIKALTELQKKIPSRNVMKSTKIGHAINKLTKHESTEVASLATQIVKSWKRHFEQKMDRPMIEVKCDRKTESLRTSGRKLLAGALQIPEKHQLVENIEREAFHQHDKLVNFSYRRSMRALVFVLKHQACVREQVLDGTLQVVDFVRQYKKADKNS